MKMKNPSWGQGFFFNHMNVADVSCGCGTRRTLRSGIGVIVFEHALHHDYQVVTACQHSNDHREKSKHRNADGTGACKGAPLFFKHCGGPESDLRKIFRPKEGFSLVILPQTRIPVWHKEYLKFFDSTVSAIQLQLRIAHGKPRKGLVLTSTDHNELRCEYPCE